jgi:hypothetical protein
MGLKAYFSLTISILSFLAHLEKFLEKKELSALQRQNGVIEVIRYCYFKYLVHAHHRLNIESDHQSLFGRYEGAIDQPR